MIAALSLPVTAQTSLRGDEAQFLGDLPIVLTPSRLPQPLDEAPGAVTVIDRALIRATGYRDLARLLRLVPGMQVGQERSSSQWVTYHGMGNDIPSWMQVLVDGRSVYSPGAFGGIDWTGLPVTLDEVERIEIIRGTNSVAYGSNAFLGAVNIITRHTTDTGTAPVTVRAGNQGIADLAAEVGNSAGSVPWRLNVESKGDNGFSGLHDGRRFTTASLRADRRLGDQDELMLRLAASNGWRDFGYADSTFGNNAERSGETTAAALHVQWRHTPSSGEEWQLSYYHNQDRQKEEWTASALRLDLSPARPAIVPLDRDRTSVRDNLELQHRIALGDTLRVVWGLELRDDQVDSPFLYFGTPHQHSGMTRLFGQGEWRPTADWTVSAGALAEKFSDDALHLSPRLFANRHLDSLQSLRFGYARAWRTPTLFERNGDIRAFDPADDRLLVQPYLPNPDLRASRIDSLEAGYLGRFATLNTQLDARLFVERIDNYIVRVSHPEVTAPLLAAVLPSARYENLTTPVTLRGIEYQIDSRPRAGTRVLFNHTLIDRRASDSFVEKLTAPYTASLSWFEEWPQNWTSTVTLLRMGSLAGGDGFVPRYQYAAPPYTSFDVRLARRFTAGGRLMEVALAGTNLGARHQEIADRSEQFLHGTDPVNQTSPMVWLTLTIGAQ